MVDVSRLVDLERELGVVDHALDAPRELLGAASASDVRSLTAAYRTALIAALGGEDVARDRFDGLAARDVAMIEPLRERVVALAQVARSRMQELGAAFTLGPLDLLIAAPGAAVAGGPVIAHLPVDSLAVSIAAGPLTASGAGFVRPDEVGAVLAAEFGAVGVTFAALVGTGDPISVFAALRAEFRPTGLQIGLGFSIDAIGGYFGLNRTIDVDELRHRLSDGSAAASLFGGSTSPGGLRSTLDTLSAIFRPAAGRSVVGPAFSVGWLNVGGWSLMRLDIAVILSLPDARVLLPGRAVLEVPGAGVPLVYLRLDLLGIIDLAGRRTTVDAVLVDSHVLGVFKLAGTAAAFLSWGPEPSAIVTVGGFFPGFRLAPALVPPQQRIVMSLSPPLPGVRVSVTGYVAAAVGTLQFGGSVSVGYDLGVASIHGTVSADALFQLTPSRFEIRVSGRVAVEALDVEVGVDCHGTVTGPGPTLLTVYASAKIFGVRFGGWKDFVLEGGRRDAAAAGALGEVVRNALEDPANYIAQNDSDPDVTLRAPPSPSPLPVLSPNGQVVWRQDRFPIGVAVEKAAGRVLKSAATVSVDPSPSGTEFAAPLATAMFLDLSVDEILSHAPYATLPIGYSFPVAPTMSTAEVTASSDFLDIDLATHTQLSGLLAPIRVDGYSHAVARASGPPVLIAPLGPVATELLPPSWHVFTGTIVSGPMLPGTALAEARASVGAVAMPAAAAVGIGI